MELIKVNKIQIENETVNSVNARELYGFLEIKQEFSNWVKKQISRASLIEEKDYLTIDKKVNRQILKEYILTIESAKHIAMMSQSKKAKEIRDYFIEVEKKYIETLKSQHLNLNPLIEVLTKSIEMQNNRFNHLEKELTETKAIMNTIKENSSEIHMLKKSSEDIQDFIKEQPIDTDQVFILRNAVDDRAMELARKHNIHSKICKNFLYSEIRDRFEIRSYIELRRTAFKNCLFQINRMDMQSYMEMPVILDEPIEPKSDIADDEQE